MQLTQTGSPHLERNLLLAALSPDEYRSLEPHLEQVSCAMRDKLHEGGQQIRFMYFPRTTLVSLMTAMQNGSEVEVGVVGNEGVVGLSIFWGSPVTSHEAVIVLSGTAAKISADALKDAINARGSHLSDLMLRYTHALVAHMSQTAACNSLHQISERVVRWLLVSHDRAGVAEFPLTHEFLADILGVRRSGVTEAISALASKGLIVAGRRRIIIVDRAALEAESCECYEIVKQAFAHFLKTPMVAGERRSPLTADEFSDAGNAVHGVIGTDLPGYRKR